MVTISIVNNKGGVGKTTTTLNLGSALAKAGKSVLLVDFDPQSSLTIYMGFNPLSFKKNSYHVITRKAKPKDVIVKTRIPNVDLLPASMDLSAAEIEMTALFGRENILREQLASIADYYDFALIDNMPSLSILTVNSLMASNYIIVPIEPTFLAYKGLEIIDQTVKEIKRYHSGLKILGVVMTMVDERSNHTKEVMKKIRESFPVFSTYIKRSIKFADASVRNQPIESYAGLGFAGSIAYYNLAQEVLERVEAEKKNQQR